MITELNDFSCNLSVTILVVLKCTLYHINRVLTVMVFKTCHSTVTGSKKGLNRVSELLSLFYFKNTLIENAFPCSFLQLSNFTQMNVWTHFVFWDGEYPKGPDDIVCRKSQQKKRNETATAYRESNVILDTGDYV